MGVFDSVISWLEDLFKPLKELYDKDSNAFFLGAILVILILLIVVIVLARRAENSEDKPAKKVKYEDIDWSFHDDAKTEEPRAESRAYQQAAAPVREAAPEQYGIKDVDVNKNTFGHEGISPEVVEVLLNSIRRQNAALDVPSWMAKETLNFDDIESIDAQEWLEQQLKEKEAKAHDVQVQKATIERIAKILERVEACDQFHEAEMKKACDEAVSRALDDLEANYEAAEPESKASEDLAATKSYETDTLSKILKEAEDIREQEEADNLLDHIENGTAYEEEDDNEPPQWDIAATLARLEAENAENDKLLRELEGTYYDGTEEPVLKDIQFEKPGEIALEESPVVNEPVVERIEVPSREQDNKESILSRVQSQADDPDRIEPSFFGNLKRPARRYGANNRDTNRAGRTFTEEELIKQIRD